MVIVSMNSLEQLEKYAKEKFIPIARKQTTEFMVNLIKENNYKSFFEVGTAIGYTSIIIATTFPNVSILTIEYNLNRAELARQNFRDFSLENNHKLIAVCVFTYTLIITCQINKKINLWFNFI